jgi:aspartate/methionine/tyrosine aminotransferase
MPRAHEQRQTGYTNTSGITPLLEALAGACVQLKERKDAPEEVVVVPAASDQVLHMLMHIDIGDEVIYPNPGFPI